MEDEHELLELLLAEAPVDAFEEPVRRARAAGASAGVLQRAHEATVRALRLRSVLAERRRREVELAALYETAGDLIGIRDVQRVLQAIVRRARRLLDADTAYITLIDAERGDTYMRVTDGMVTEAFKRIRLPLGVGLGGLVAQTGTPYFTSDYASDTRFHHTGDIDGVVSGEALNAILGVPLKTGDDTIGVLFAANRLARPFTADEVHLLGSLAAHAAIAIENARLFQEAREAVERLNEANAAVQAHAEAVERAAAVHQRLTDVVLRGGSMSEVAAAVAGTLGGALRVVDDSGRSLAVVGADDGAATPDEDVLLEALAGAQAAGRTVPLGGGTDAWVAPVVAGSERLGGLVLTGRRALDAVDSRTLERAAQVTALLLLNERAVAEAELRIRSEVLDDLLSRPQRDPDGLARRARLVGIDVDQPHVVVVASTPPPHRRRLVDAAAALARRAGGVASERRACAVLVLPSMGAEEAAAVVREALAPATRAPITAGVAGPAAGLDGILEAYEDAERRRRALGALGRSGEVATADDLGVYALLLSNAGEHEVDRFVSRALGPVLAYDSERGSDLAATLETWFEHGRNATRTAAALPVHINTLYQRFERIGALLGRDWQDAERALQLHLALRLRRLQQAPDARGGGATTH